MSVENWRKQEAAYDDYLIKLRAWLPTTKKIPRQDVANLLAALIEYRERYLSLADKDA